MKIKTKLVFGIGFLFAAFLILGSFSLYFTFRLSKQVELIMKDNHLSLEYTENMLQSIDKINSIEASYIFKKDFQVNESELQNQLKIFEQNLGDEGNNITEIGENEQVQFLKDNFNKYVSLLILSRADSVKEKSQFYFNEIVPGFTSIKTNIFTISDLNMQAIVRKSDSTKETASHSYIVLSSIATICFLVFFLFIFGFPSYIANPIKVLTESVREISNRNFTARVHFATNDEFGEISNAFNTMASRLEEFDNAQSVLSLNGKERSEAVMNKLQEALIILDEHKKITFVNSFAEKLLDLSPVESLNKYAPDLAKKNEIISFLINDIDHFQNKQNQSIMIDYKGVKTKFVREVSLVAVSKKAAELLVPIGHIIYLRQEVENHN